MSPGPVFCAVTAILLFGASPPLLGQPPDIHDWGRVTSLEPGSHLWVRTSTAALTELVLARATDEHLRVGVWSEMSRSRASEREILPRCADPPKGSLVVRGERVDLAVLCRTLQREEIVEAYARKKGSPVRSVLVGAGISTTAMFLPCQVAPQANGSQAGCELASAVVGALIGSAVHGARRGQRVLIYRAETLPPTWDGENVGEKLARTLVGLSTTRSDVRSVLR